MRSPFRSVASRLCALVLALSVLPLVETRGLGQSQEQPSFRAGVDLVQVDVSVLDKRRQPVSGLTASDFTLLEDGHVRPVVAFSEVVLPSRRLDPERAAWLRDVAPEAATNTLPDDGRIVVIVMDRSIPDGYPSISARQIAKAAIDEMADGDLGAVVFTGNGAPQDLTADRARLTAAVERSNPAAGDSAAVTEYWNTMVTELFADLNRFVPGDADPSATHQLPTAWGAVNYSTDCLCGACVLESIGRIADALRDVPRRRKTLLFIGTDLNVETTDSICVDPVRRARAAMFRSLDMANVTVHSLDPLGLETVSLQASSSGRTRNPSGGLGFQGGRSAVVVDAGPRANNLQRQGNIAVLPDRTGGRTVVNVNDPNARIAEIFHESDSYYLLGFPPGALDGRRHDIKVKVNRRGIDVHTRRAYLATSAARVAAPVTTTATTARDAIVNTLPTREGITLHAVASSFEAPDTHKPVVAVSMHVQHAEAGFTGSAKPEDVEVVTGIFTMGGQPVGALRQTLSVRPRADKTGAVYDVLQRIPAKAGRYEIRIGVRNNTRRQTGSVQLFVDVPAFDRLRFTVSDIGVYAPAGPPAMKDTLADLVPAPPTARRMFERGERVTAFIRLYQRDEGLPHDVAVAVRLVDQHDQEVFAERGGIDATKFWATKMADFVLRLPLTDLDSGPYLLEFLANGTGTTLRRTMRFEVN
jgi:VWFA-related protein